MGDRLEAALTAVGLTQEQISQWLGTPCNCDERKEKLNALDSWARRVLRGKIVQAKSFLYRIMGVDQ